MLPRSRPPRKYLCSARNTDDGHDGEGSRRRWCTGRSPGSHHRSPNVGTKADEDMTLGLLWAEIEGQIGQEGLVDSSAPMTSARGISIWSIHTALSELSSGPPVIFWPRIQ